MRAGTSPYFFFASVGTSPYARSCGEGGHFPRPPAAPHHPCPLAAPNTECGIARAMGGPATRGLEVATADNIVSSCRRMTSVRCCLLPSAYLASELIAFLFSFATILEAILNPKRQVRSIAAAPAPTLPLAVGKARGGCRGQRQRGGAWSGRRAGGFWRVGGCVQ